jgi:hypothetical protein
VLRKISRPKRDRVTGERKKFMVSTVPNIIRMIKSGYPDMILRLPWLILRLPWLWFFRAFSSVVRQILGYNSQRRGTAALFQINCYLCCSMYCVCLNVYGTLPPGVIPIADHKFIVERLRLSKPRTIWTNSFYHSLWTNRSLYRDLRSSGLLSSEQW